ncbi:uncharacterized protein V6R79_005065 [Siganus canaliculatus]
MSAAAEDESGLVEVFDTTLDISQDTELAECAAPEKTDSNDTLKQEDGQTAGQQDGQDEGEAQEKSVSSPADESCSSSQSESKWVVGAPCQAVWSEDGRQYLAKIVSLDKEHCRVRFDGYGNEEDMELSALKSPDADLQNSQDWRAGSRCRAVYSEDGLVYPAVVLWVKGQRCRVRFDEYNNEEELDIGSLLSVDELHGLGRSPKQGSGWKPSTDWRRKRREESQGERGGADRRSGRRDEQQSSRVKDKQSNQSNMEKESEEKKSETEKSSAHSFPFFPPFPPPQLSSADPVFIPPPPPPPPPLWAGDGKESGAISAASSMLMLWYMCGFHTGSYLAQQEFKSKH